MRRTAKQWCSCNTKLRDTMTIAYIVVFTLAASVTCMVAGVCYLMMRDLHEEEQESTTAWTGPHDAHAPKDSCR